VTATVPGSLGYHLAMGLRRLVGLDLRDSRLGELGTLTRELLETAARRVAEAEASAAPSEAPPTPPASEYRPERTLAHPDFLPAWFLRVGVERARSVARIELLDEGKPYFGTGFMLSPSLMMTNHHVLPNIEAARGARVFFDYEDDERGRQLSPQVFLTQPDRYFLANEILDFALVAVDGQPGRRWGTIPLCHAPAGLEPGARVNLIQHPGGGCKQIVVYGNRITKIADVALHYLADTEGGSSGSPVFNSRWELIALHHWGGVRDNVGVRMDQILKFLTVKGSERGAGPLLRELLEGVVDSGDFGLFATTGLTPPSPEERRAVEGPEERLVLDWMGGAEFLDPGYWDLAPLFVGSVASEVEHQRPKLEAIAELVDEAGADFMVLENIPAQLRAPLAEALRAREQGTMELGERALLCLDPAVSAEACVLEGEAAEIASGTCRGRPVLPPGFVQLQLTLARPGAASARALYLLFVELDPAHDLPSRAHRNELARVLGTLALSSGGDVVVMGALAGVLDRPGLRELVAPPELTILASPLGGDSPDVAAIAWIGDGQGADLEHVYCWPEVRSLHLDAKVERHDFERRVPLPLELSAAGAPLLLRGRFGELERAGTHVAEASGGVGREIEIDRHVKSIVLT
jgi:V8-like Glu-specific endopeptidase